jgi:hypothetical protein
VLPEAVEPAPGGLCIEHSGADSAAGRSVNEPVAPGADTDSGAKASRVSAVPCDDADHRSHGRVAVHRRSAPAHYLDALDRRQRDLCPLHRAGPHVVGWDSIDDQVYVIGFSAPEESASHGHWELTGPVAFQKHEARNIAESIGQCPYRKAFDHAP